MGVWVIAHECGHQAFSESKQLNNAVGWVLHSAFVFWAILAALAYYSPQSWCPLPFMAD